MKKDIKGKFTSQSQYLLIFVPKKKKQKKVIVSFEKMNQILKKRSISDDSQIIIKKLKK